MPLESSTNSLDNFNMGLFVKNIDDGSGTFGDPLLGTPSALHDRYIGNDTVGSYVTLSTPTFMHKDYWFFDFKTKAGAPILDTILYIEELSTNGFLENKITTGTIDATKLRVFIRNTTNAIKADATSDTLSPFDGGEHICRVAFDTDTNDLTLTVDGVDEIIDINVTGTVGDGDENSISFTSSDFAGMIWDMNLNGVLIPLDDGVDDIKDSDGNIVGTLTDPDGTFWDYYIPYDQGSGNP